MSLSRHNWLLPLTLVGLFCAAPGFGAVVNWPYSTTTAMEGWTAFVRSSVKYTDPVNVPENNDALWASAAADVDIVGNATYAAVFYANDLVGQHWLFRIRVDGTPSMLGER